MASMALSELTRLFGSGPASGRPAASPAADPSSRPGEDERGPTARAARRQSSDAPAKR